MPKKEQICVIVGVDAVDKTCLTAALLKHMPEDVPMVVTQELPPDPRTYCDENRTPSLSCRN